MWQSLVTIGPETSEIRRRKKKKVSKMIETSAVKYNGRRPASWRAAIIMSQSAEIIYDVNLSVLSHNTRDRPTLCTVVIFLPTKRRLLSGKRLFDENVIFLFYLQCMDERPNNWMVTRQKFGKTAMPVAS